MKNLDRNSLLNFLDAQKDEAARLLAQLIRFPSTQGQEAEIQEFLHERFRALGLETELLPISPSLKADPEYSFSDLDIDYDERPNLVATLQGTGGGRSVMLNAHSDVVPAGQWPGAFEPEIKGDYVYGRGACDDKGKIVVMYLALSGLKEFGLRPRGDIIATAVIEEEVGGNGSLALIRGGLRADAVVVLECTEFTLAPAHRGCLWFRAQVEGRATHLGKTREAISAIDEATELIQILKNYEKNLIAQSKGHPLFPEPEEAVQLNIGMIAAGEWPSTVPSRCVLEGGVGFLPNKTLEQVKRELKEAVQKEGNEWLREHFQIDFPKLHNDAYETPADHPLVETFGEAMQEAGLDPTPKGWIVSCDARLFSKLAGLPTIVFGPGRLIDCHSNEEKISIPDILKAAEVLTLFLLRWCGTE